MAKTRAADTQLRTYPAFPAAPHNEAGEPGLTMAFFLSSRSSGSLPSGEAYRHGPGTNAQRLTSESDMSDPLWREERPSTPYGREPGARPPGRDARLPATGPRTPATGPRSPAGGSGVPKRYPWSRDPCLGSREPGMRGAGGSRPPIPGGSRPPIPGG